MQVFKLYFHLLKKNLPSMLIYMAIFLSIIIYLTLNSGDKKDMIFSENKVDVAFINDDEDSPLVNGFRSYLDNYCNFIDIPDDEISLKDALFFRRVVYIIRIPDGFTENFMNGENVKVEKTSVPNVAEAISVDIAVDRFFNTAAIYEKHIQDMDQNRLVSLVKDNLDIKANVTMFSENTQENHQLIVKYYNFICYGLVSILVLGVGMIMLSMQKLDIKRRNLVSPMSTTSINIQLIIGNIVFTIGCLAVFVIAGAIITPGFKLDKTSAYLLLNAIVFSLSILSISFLVGIAIKSKNAANAIANVLSLGMSFLSGVFMPQEFLGDDILKISAFTPSYWYVKANNAIGTLTDFSISSLEDIHRSMLIEIGFAAAIFAIALVVSKKKSQEAS